MTNDKKVLNTNATDSTGTQNENCCKANVVRAVIYTRTTQVDQSDDYLNQVRKCDTYIKSKGWALNEIFLDEGKSRMAQKPYLSLMMMKAAQYSFDIIVVSNLDRISRSPKEVVEISKILLDFHVTLQSADEPENVLLRSNESVSF
jgi:DNA invertase Pin-like site-specific DNA recombinase